MKKVAIVLVLGFVLGPDAFAQKGRLDSLLRVLKTQPEANADRMNTLIRLAETYATISYPKSIESAHEAWRIADELDEDKGRAEAWMSECLTLYRLGEWAASDSVDRLARSVADPVKTPRAYALAIQWGHCANDGSDTAFTELARREIVEAIKIFYALGDSADLAWSLYGYGQNWGWNTNADTLLKAMAMAKRNGETAIQLTCMSSLGNFEPYESDTAFHIHNEESILHLADSAGDIEAALLAHMSLNYYFSNRTNHVPALAHMIEALPLAEALGDVTVLAGLECNYGYTLLDLGMHEEATAHFRKGMALPANSLFFRLNLRTGMAENFLKQHLPDSALVYLREAEGMANEDEVEGVPAEIHGLMAEAYVQKGDYGPVFVWWEEALAKHSTLAWTGQIEAREAVKYGRALLAAPAEALRANGMDRIAGQKRAGEVLRHALRIGRDLALLDEQSEALLGLSELATQQGDSATAFRYHLQYTMMKDSILDADKAKVFALMQVRFQTEQKEQQIALLGKDKEVQAKEIQKQKLVRNGFIGGFAFVALFAGVFLFQRNRISKEKKRSEELLLNILPAEVAEELKAKGEADAKQIDQVTVLFTDFKGFTSMSEQLTPKELVADIHECFSAFDHIMAKHGIEKIKTIGDAYMAAGGLPTPNTTHALDVVKAAFEIRDFIAEGKARKVAAGLPYFEIRIGIHTGPVVAGIVGVKKFAYDIWGDTVNTASRMESSGEVGQVNISEATYALVKDEPGLSFTPRGKVQAKGKGEMEMYFASRSLDNGVDHVPLLP